MKIYKFVPRENINGPDMTEILTAGPTHYADLPERLMKHFEIIVVPDPVKKAAPVVRRAAKVAKPVAKIAPAPVVFPVPAKSAHKAKK